MYGVPATVFRMRERRPGRFSRAWQRQRAEQAEAEHAEDSARFEWAARRLRLPFYVPLANRVSHDDQVRPYRGFRNGRARRSPTGTGYEEPVEPIRQPPGNEHPWLADLTEEPPTGPVIGEDDHR